MSNSSEKPLVVLSSYTDISGMSRVPITIQGELVKRCKSVENQGCGELLPASHFVRRIRRYAEGTEFYYFEPWCKLCDKVRRVVNKENREKQVKYKTIYDKSKQSWRVLEGPHTLCMQPTEARALDYISDLLKGVGMWNLFLYMPAPEYVFDAEIGEMIRR